jgi:hypothetical protein
LDPQPLIAELKKFDGKDSAFVSYAGDTEAWDLCNHLVHIFTAAGWRPTDRCGQEPWIAPPRYGIGVTFFGPNKDEAAKIADLISRAAKLESFGGPYKSPVFTVFVGQKQGFMRGQARGARDANKSANKK